MGIREELAVKRLEISLMESDVRVEDLEAEIEKVKEKKAITEKGLSELREVSE